jgi:eukaryotic-like serine/threonine-protein kinase
VTDAGTLTSLHRGKLALTDTTAAGGATTKWEFPPSTDKSTKLQGVYGTPTVVGDKVVFGAYNGRVYELNLADGRSAWAQNGKDYSYNAGSSIVGSVVSAGDSLFFGDSDGQVVALKLSDGTPIGSYKTGERVWSTPVVDGGTVYVTSMDRKLYAFNIDDFNGKGAKPQPLWQRTVADGAIASGPTLDGGQIYISSFDKRVYALSQKDGTVMWRSPLASNWFWCKTFVANGTAYAGSLDNNIYAFDTATGAEKWHKPLSNSIRGEPLIAQGVLVVADRSGRVVGLDPGTGDLKWKQPLELNSTTLGDLALSSDKQSVLIVTEGGKGGSQLAQINPVTGDVMSLEKA